MAKVNRGRPKDDAKAAASERFDWPRLGRWLSGLMLFALMGAGGMWVAAQLRDPAVLPLKVVRIDGQLRYLERSVIESAVSRAVRGNFFMLDVERVKAAAQKLPWVARASVRRIWPDILQMKVVEQVPLARWGARGLVNHNGGTFAPAAEQIPDGLPMLSGPVGTAPEVVRLYKTLHPRLALLGLQLSHLQLDARLAWRLEFTDGLRLQLGSRDIENRMERFIRIYPRLAEAADQRLLGIDLRYTNGFAVRWESQQAVSQPAVRAVAGRGRV